MNPTEFFQQFDDVVKAQVGKNIMVLHELKILYQRENSPTKSSQRYGIHTTNGASGYPPVTCRYELIVTADHLVPGINVQFIHKGRGAERQTSVERQYINTDIPSIMADFTPFIRQGIFPA